MQKAANKFKTASFTLKNLPSTPKKTQPVASLISGLNCREALNQLLFCQRKPAKKMFTFLRSCVTNCENTHGMDPNRLLLTEVICGRTRKIKRIRIHARGRHGVQEDVKTNIRFVIREIPPQPNEKKLGRYGWKHETWKLFEERVGRMRGALHKLSEEFEKTGRRYIPEEALKSIRDEMWGKNVSNDVNTDGDASTSTDSTDDQVKNEDNEKKQ